MAVRVSAILETADVDESPTVSDVSMGENYFFFLQVFLPFLA